MFFLSKLVLLFFLVSPSEKLLHIQKRKFESMFLLPLFSSLMFPWFHFQYCETVWRVDIYSILFRILIIELSSFTSCWHPKFYILVFFDHRCFTFSKNFQAFKFNEIIFNNKFFHIQGFIINYMLCYEGENEVINLGMVFLRLKEGGEGYLKVLFKQIEIVLLSPRIMLIM